MSLDLDKLSPLLDLLAQKDIAEFEHEEGGARIRIVRGALAARGEAVAIAAPVPARGATPAPAPSAESEALAANFVDLTSPFVGSFYCSPSPDTPAFVEVGSVVRPGQTLCIIEAMKLMNEIESEWAGTVVEIFAQNGKNVEYGQKLFRIKKA